MKGERQEEEVSRKRVTVKRFNGLKFVRPSPSQFVGRLIRDRWFHQKREAQRFFVGIVEHTLMDLTSTVRSGNVFWLPSSSSFHDAVIAKIKKKKGRIFKKKKEKKRFRPGRKRLVACAVRDQPNSWRFVTSLRAELAQDDVGVSAQFFISPRPNKDDVFLLLFLSF